MFMAHGAVILPYINLYAYSSKGNVEPEDENLNLINFAPETEILNIISICKSLAKRQHRSVTVFKKYLFLLLHKSKP